MAKNRVIASLTWKISSGIHIDQQEVFAQMGYESLLFLYNQPIPKGTDIVVIQGPFGSLEPFVDSYYRIPSNERPKVIYWFEESLFGNLHPKLYKSISFLFSNLVKRDKNFRSTISKFNQMLFSKIGKRIGWWGDILWLYKHKVLDLLAVSGSYYQEELKRSGVPAILVPRGYHPNLGSFLNLERDIDVVWMGKFRSERRKKIIYNLKSQLDKHALKMEIFDGETTPFIYGKKRTQILNRSNFVLNVLSQPYDELSIRFFIAGANGAVVLTEPNFHQYPFCNGVHWVESKPDKMINEIMYYRENPEKRQKIARNMYDLITNQLTLKNSLSSLLNRVECH